MKQKIVNEIRLTSVVFATTIGFLLLLIFGLRNAHNLIGTISTIVIFGGGLVFCFVCFLMMFELICLSEDKIISYKILKRVQISYDEIVSIQDTEKNVPGYTVEQAWEIVSSSQRVICVIKSKKREKIIAQLKKRIKE